MPKTAIVPLVVIRDSLPRFKSTGFTSIVRVAKLLCVPTWGTITMHLSIATQKTFPRGFSMFDFWQSYLWPAVCKRDQKFMQPTAIKSNPFSSLRFNMKTLHGPKMTCANSGCPRPNLFHLRIVWGRNAIQIGRNLCAQILNFSCARKTGGMDTVEMWSVDREVEQTTSSICMASWFSWICRRKIMRWKKKIRLYESWIY